MVRRFTLYQKSSWAGASFMTIYDGSTRIWKHFQLLDRRQSTDTRAHNPAHGFFFWCHLIPRSVCGNFLRVLCLSKCCGEKIVFFRYPDGFQVAILRVILQL